MRFIFAVIPAVFLASTVYGLEASAKEAYSVKDMNHRIAEMIEQGGFNINSILEEMEISDIHSDVEEEDLLAEHGGFVELDADEVGDEDEDEDEDSLPSLPSKEDFGRVTVDLRPYLNLLYHVFKPVDTEDIHEKFVDVLHKTFVEPFSEKNSKHVTDKSSVDEILKALLKTVKLGEKRDSK